MLSVFDIFKIGIGPSSSHTVGPMRIAARFLQEAVEEGVLGDVARVRVELQGSLALTGVGHGSDKAAILGLLGEDPETVDPDEAEAAVARVRDAGRLRLPGGREIAFDPKCDLELRGDIIPTLHPNGMRLVAYDADGNTLLDRTHYSVGGGFIASSKQLESPAEDDLIVNARSSGPHPFSSAEELIQLTDATGRTIADLVLENEDAKRPRAETIQKLDAIWSAMNGCIDRGLAQRGVLPGGLKVKRRAPDLWAEIEGKPLSNERERLFDWLNVYAMAVNEENAAGGRVVTAPTNGAAGVIPSVVRHCCGGDDGSPEKIRTFLITAAAIGMLYKQRASISGAEMGCQGEVGVACSMAAAGLAAAWGGTVRQIEHAAEIGMEHNLGLTCDPVGGLVQVPCIERNAIGAVKAANAARLALRSSGDHKVSLDQVIETMRQTGLDMSSKYKETSQGGLAVNVVEC